MQNYLDLVRQHNLDTLLEKEPDSKFLRSYLKQLLRTPSLPVLTTWQEWQEWLQSQVCEPTTCPPPAKIDENESGIDLEDFTPTGYVEASKNYELEVYGTVTARAERQFDFNDLVLEYESEVREILEPLFECETLEELEALDLDAIYQEVTDYLYDACGSSLDDMGWNYDSGEIDVNEDRTEIYDTDTEIYNLTGLVETFVDNLYAHLKQQLETDDEGDEDDEDNEVAF